MKGIIIVLICYLIGNISFSFLLTKLKLKKKNLDLIVLNSLRDEGAGFQKDTNKVTLISKDNKVLPFPVKPKSEVAKDILEFIIDRSHA